MKKTDVPVVVEETFIVSVEKVWKAITDRDLMIQWFFDNIPAFKPEIGFKTEFNVVSGERNFLHKWEVLEAIPNQKIKYNWKYEDYTGDANVIFELSEQGKETQLKLTVEVLEDFQEGIPEFNRESCVGGWEYFLQGNLKRFLDGNS